MCDFCREDPLWVGKTNDGLLTYTCDMHKKRLATEIHKLEKPKPMTSVGESQDEEAAMGGELF